MPKDEDSRASMPGAQSASAPLPGVWQAAVIAALSALIAGYWARPGDSAPGGASAANVSTMAEVAPQETAAALDTVWGSREQLAQLQQRDSCSRRLAWVTIMRSPGQPPGRIRLQSGNYFSPGFELTEAPVRVALPYPAPYASGHGTISVVGTTTGAIVALTPPWQIPAGAGLHAREVTWSPSADCPEPKP